MTKEEIKALIDAKIAGQGSAIDAASVLPAILEGIIDLIPEEYSLPVANKETLGGIKVGDNLTIDNGGKLTSRPGVLTVSQITVFEERPLQEVLQILGITIQELEDLKAGRYSAVRSSDLENIYIISLKNDGDYVYFFHGDASSWGAAYVLLYVGEGLYTLSEV